MNEEKNDQVIHDYLTKRINDDTPSLENLHPLVLYDTLVSEIVTKFHESREDAKRIFVSWLRTMSIWIEYQKDKYKNMGKIVW